MVDPSGSTLMRWGLTTALLLAAQSLLMGAMFWGFSLHSRDTAMDRVLRSDCATYATMSSAARGARIRSELDADIHRDRFLALFDAEGEKIAGNVAWLPTGVEPNAPPREHEVAPTELPGKSRDSARLIACTMPGGDILLTGNDLDASDHAARIVENTLMLSIIPALLLALGGGVLAMRQAGAQIDAVRRLAERIDAGELGRRLPVAERPDSFGLLCRHINQMLDRIETLMAEVRGTGDDIAHQLRTPLTRMRARIEREMGGAETPEAFEAASAAALRNIDQALAVVAALLRIREIEAHRRRRFASVDLARLLSDVVELHEPAAEERDIRLELQVDRPEAIEGDSDLLMEAVSNLVDNAIKFSPAGSTTVVALTHDGPTPAIEVRDEAGGVGPEEHKLVVQRFYRRREHLDLPGSGLGLSLVKAIVELHGFGLRFSTGPAPRAGCAMILCRRSK